MKMVSIVKTLFGLLVALMWNQNLNAQDAPSYECDNQFGACGTPEQSGGGGGGGGGSILINNTDVGDTYQFADDYDDDGIEDPYDNCPFANNLDQTDGDGDSYGYACDNCPDVGNVDQSDLDGDGQGDTCDTDMDNDGVANGEDICSENPDPLQKDADKDGIGDACDDDMDNDGVPNLEDECPLVPNGSMGTETSKSGVMCDDDDDGDSIRNTNDNCPQMANYEQDDADDDGLGDVCDSDNDNDGIGNLSDNCPFVANEMQDDGDRDKVGDACDDEYCYVVFGDTVNCLDPTDPFAVHVPSLKEIMTGDSVRVRLFANRENKPMVYSLTIEEAPAGSSATIKNASGDVSLSTPYEYHYTNGSAATFVPDKPGVYRIRLIASLNALDGVTGVVNPTAETYAEIMVEGSALDKDTLNCSVSAVGHSNEGWIIGLLGIMLLGTRLRRSKN